MDMRLLQGRFLFLGKCAGITLFIAIFFGIPNIGTAADCSLLKGGAAIPSGYGAPYTPADSSMLIKADCTPAGVVVTTGKSGSKVYTYKVGYEWNSSKWMPITFSGAKTSGEWLVGSAVAPLTNPGLGKSGSVVAYTCEKRDEKWQCGCRDAACTQSYWQIQRFTVPVTMAAPASATNSVSQFAQSPIPGSFEDSLLRLDSPIFLSVSKQEAQPGDAITVSGGGFLAENTVKIKDDAGKIVTIGVASGGTGLIFRLPNDIPYGKYRMWIENKNGSTPAAAPLVIKPKGVLSPKVMSVTPSSGEYGATVTLHGSGFTPTGNDIRTTYDGYITNVPSPDGKTLTITVEPYPETFAKPDSRRTESFSTTVRFFVINANGVTMEPGAFTINLK